MSGSGISLPPQHLIGRSMLVVCCRKRTAVSWDKAAVRRLHGRRQLTADAAGRSWRDLPFKACPMNANLVIEDRPEPRIFVGPASKGPDEARDIVSLISVVMTLASGFVEVGSGLA